MSDVDVAIAQGRVPSGVSREILLESKDRPAIVGILIVTVLTSLFVCGRVASRALLVRRFGYDDALAAMSWVSVFKVLYCPHEIVCMAAATNNNRRYSSPLSA
jgi:hypothetical protein